jgi:hypothetical protein
MQPLYSRPVFSANLKLRMKHFLIVVLLMGSFSLLQAQQTVTRSIGSFTGIKAQEGIDVFIKKGNKESIRIEANGTTPENVITEISGSYLKIHMKDNVRGKIDVKVYVEYVSIDRLSVSSAASILSEGTIQATNLELNASSAGEMKISVEAENVSISASSAGEVKAKGKCKSVSADASSAGEVDAYDLEAKSASAQASSGGSVQVYVTENLVAQASSGGDVKYRGNPDKSVTNSSSGGSVKKTN